MDALFHYTNAAGVVGICSSQSVYATDYRFLNDTSEVSSIRGLIMPIFETDVSKIMPELVQKGILKEGYYTELGRRVDQLEAEGLYQALVKTVDNVSPFFVVSFCRHDSDSDEYKDGLLSQWRGYADGSGFAIEFDEADLDALAKKEKDSFAYAGFRSDDVNYYAHEETFDAADYRGAAGEMLRGAFESVGIDISGVSGKININDVVIAFAKTAPFLKHPAFLAEDEYRMVFVCFRSSKVEKESRITAKKIKVREKGGVLVPYIELFETISDPLPIKSIIVGPHPYQSRQEEAVKMLLEAENIKASVRCSRIPFRK